MPFITFETSERADCRNWVKAEILKNNLGLLSFEGYTVKCNRVSLLLERGLCELQISAIGPEDVLDFLQVNSGFMLDEKLAFAKALQAPLLFFVYSYLDERCAVYGLDEGSIRVVAMFETFAAFGRWTMQYRDLNMTSPYEETGLPRVDAVLRSAGSPWPGNLDNVLLKENVPVAIIEFQRTEKVPVREHCNNTWFLPVGNRKGDVNRWRAIDIIRKQSGLPLLIIVWSAQEKEIKLKFVDTIVYPGDQNPKKGLTYKYKDVMSSEKLIEVLSHF